MGGTTYNHSVTGSVYLWGAQLEQGNYPTSYVETSGTTVSRSSDNVLYSDASNEINESEGTWYFKWDFSFPGNRGERTVFNLQPVSIPPPNHGLKINSILSPELTISGNTLPVIGDVVDETSFNSFAYSYESNLLETLFYNGLNHLAISNTLMVPGGSLENLYLGSNQSNSYLDGHLKKVIYWNTPLSLHGFENP
jgi:hypothetical protein